MHLRRIQLKQFRNYEALDLSFPSGVNIFVGDNAQGKTNLLESFFLLSLGRSFRTTDDADLIRHHNDTAHIRADVDREAGEVTIDMTLRRRGPKQVHVGGERLRRMADLPGTVFSVVFFPDDLQLLKGSPSKRRSFIDAEIAQISSVYRYHFLRYQKVLTQRNHLLRGLRARDVSWKTVAPWNDQLVAEGVPIIVKRAETIRRLGQWAQDVHADLTGGKEHLQMHYRPFFAADDEDYDPAWEQRDGVTHRFHQALEARREAEAARGVTLVGPQRDDIAFLIGGMDARSFASQGQQRSAVLATKLAEIELFKEETGEYPLLLLDDVMSELDDHRKAYFLNAISGKVNTFITTTDLHGFSHGVRSQAAVFRVQGGIIKFDKGDVEQIK